MFFDPRTRPILIYAVLVITLGAALYHWLEGWSWLDSFYYVVITLTTIGYGDFSPTTPLTKLIPIFYSLNGVIMLMMLFDVVRRMRKWDFSSRPEEDEMIQ
ncbi:MAG: potassium channel family protein [Chloroflexota bacterium]|nr:potassium channel family protein [Chloroflexota bacterium]